MTIWDNIPNEIFEQILNALDHRVVFQSNGDKWPLVNKHWYSVYLFLAYKEIVVDFYLTFQHNTQARNIMNSVDQPGHWVNTIT